MTEYIFPLPAMPSVSVARQDGRFPVRRIYCVGRNYGAHAKEMGITSEREPPFFFLKPADAIAASGEPVAYPARTANFHHEVELVVAIGLRGRDIAPTHAIEHVFGYAVGCDYTRRDLQLASRDKGQPWETGKACTAALTTIHPVAEVGHVVRGRIWLEVNGEMRQQGDVSELIWGAPEIIAELSTYFELEAGDLIFTGTPAGVGAVRRGDLVTCGIDGLDCLVNSIA